jgi:fatty-acyl-CoA synthase
MVSIATCPLMHGTGMWIGSMIPHMMGGVVVTIPNLGLDPVQIWQEISRNKVSFVVIVGDAFAKPLLSELDRAHAEGSPYDISSVKAMMSSGVMWSAEVKAGLLKHHDMMLIDAMGSTEGSMGTSIAMRGAISQTAKFTMGAEVKVFDENDKEVTPGSGQMGMIGTAGNVPLGYYKDPEKSALTFREVNGVRYSFPGDFATIEADGSINLLGRGSKCINTAGEKVFPEEVEEAIKRQPAIKDCLVVGLPDPKFGQRIVAVASLQDGMQVDEADLINDTRQHLSGYKLPKQVFYVSEVQRAPNGKADYKWAEQTAVELAGEENQ